jgi:3-deoxy-manno-octulosonate cytidylyltransferase (CMP-KDO synthetase)
MSCKSVMGGSSPWAPWLVHTAVAVGAITIAAAANRYWFHARSKGRPRVVGIIPARYKSSRFEGKPLVHIMGKPMIQRTWEQAMKCTLLQAVVVATDDERIADCCREFAADVIMTSESCKNGTERCNEALGGLSTEYDIVVNIQGDEPLIDPVIIDGIVLALQRSPDAIYSTAVTALKPEDASNPNRVKCIVDKHGYALYFSRGLLPSNLKGSPNPNYPYLLHLGIQCYDAKFLKVYSSMPPSPLQLEEDLEQLKVLEYGYKLKVIKVDHEAHGVDTPGDIAKVEAVMRAQHLD